MPRRERPARASAPQAAVNRQGSTSRSAPDEDYPRIRQSVAPAGDLIPSSPRKPIASSSSRRSKPSTPPAATSAPQLSPTRSTARQAPRPTQAPAAAPVPPNRRAGPDGTRPATWAQVVENGGRHEPAIIPKTTLSNEFYNHLASNSRVYEEQLAGTAFGNNKYKTPKPYTIKVSYEEMWELSADVGLIRDICNGRINKVDCCLLPSARKFVRKFLLDNGFVIEETTINGTCLSFNGFPERMQMFEDFRKTDALVQCVPIIRGKTSILTPTFHGSRVMQTLIVGILANHSRRISWGGKFSEENIVIIEWKSKISRGHTRDWAHYEMKIQGKLVEDKDQSLLEAAMARDLCKTAEIFIPFYKKDGDLPVLFMDLKEELEGASVKDNWLKNYLIHHPAIMPSAGRRIFLTNLHRALLVGCSDRLHAFMATKPHGHPCDWKTVVESETKGVITVLHTVYYHNKKHGTEYGSSRRELIRFMRNVLEHGKEQDARAIYGDCELELYLVKMFDSFFPGLVRTLLETGAMNDLEEAWSSYEVFKLIKLTGSRVKENTNGQKWTYYV
ncbi:uncharacterized protein LOC119294474 [Triticum dicoccoides]|uniref:uncharacterized protein LOC119294474 n=1 Tax=Triticum dicoccoides TaxID=85692 RepID=UPI00188F1636|nr:uncharacterized protein LOC119294474 [Triticum dicoccoides]XP_037428558.1 uncharacterized protein LOC119294474 [Triticum dicoccoides]XP_037428560.1 uncharacterized protein LOC119294474 [Triticum dicoccoides]XP_037428561.1 uncharacterized protein LOC119294474 [Triticum dicoccoides]